MTRVTDKRKIQIGFEEEKEINFIIIECRGAAHPLALFQPCIYSQDQFLSLEIMCPGVYLSKPLFVREKAFCISHQEINSAALS